MNIPFGFLTGFQDNAIPQEFRDRPVVAKPFTAAQLGGAAVGPCGPPGLTKTARTVPTSALAICRFTFALCGADNCCVSLYERHQSASNARDPRVQQDLTSSPDRHQNPSRGHRDRQADHLRAQDRNEAGNSGLRPRVRPPANAHRRGSRQSHPRRWPVRVRLAHLRDDDAPDLCDGPLRNTASLGSPGVDEVRWTRPVRPGDVLSCRHVYTEKRELASRPDVGISKITLELLGGNGEVLAWWHTNQLTRRRNPGAARTAPSRPKPPHQSLVSLWDASPPPQPARSMFFEDRQIGEISDFGRHTFNRDEIITFARQFDPQPFHIDDAAAKASLFGALCASGWHTAAIFIREVVTHRLTGNAATPSPGERQPAYGPSPGFRDLRWPKPVYVGDTIDSARASPRKSISSHVPAAVFLRARCKPAIRRARSCLRSFPRSWQIAASHTDRLERRPRGRLSNHRA